VFLYIAMGINLPSHRTNH